MSAVRPWEDMWIQVNNECGFVKIARRSIGAVRIQGRIRRSVSISTLQLNDGRVTLIHGALLYSMFLFSHSTDLIKKDDRCRGDDD